MKKGLLLLALAAVHVVSAQDIRTAKRVYNFSGSKESGKKGSLHQMHTSGNNVMVNDRFGNPESAIQSLNGQAYHLPYAMQDIPENGSYTIGFWYKKIGNGSEGISGNWNSVKPFFAIPNSSHEPYGEGTFIGFDSFGSQLKVGHSSYTHSTIKMNTYPFPAGYVPTDWNYYLLSRTQNNELHLYINNEFVGAVGGINWSSYFNSTKTVVLGGHWVGQYSGFSRGHFDSVRIFQGELNVYARTQLMNYENNDRFRNTWEADALYSFDNAPGTDSYGYYNANTVGTYNRVENRFGEPNKALKIEQYPSDYFNISGLRIPYLNEYFRSSNSVTMWIKPEGNHYFNSDNEVVLINFANGLANNASNGASLLLGLKDTPEGLNYFVRVSYIDYQNQVVVSEEFVHPTPISPENWHQVGATLSSSGELKMYYNGAAVITSDLSSTAGFPNMQNAGGMDVLIAHGDSNTCNKVSGYDGIIDDISLSKNIRSAESYANEYGQYTDFLNTVSLDRQSVQLMPNPVKDIMYLSQNASVKVFDLTGRQVLIATDVEQVDFTGLTSGTYLVEIKQGERTQIQKVLKS